MSLDFQVLTTVKKTAYMEYRKLVKLSRNTHFNQYWYEKLNIDMLAFDPRKVEFWKAFKNASQNLYPVLDESKGLLSSRDAQALINDKISKNVLLDKEKEGYLRLHKDKNRFYAQEIELFNVIFAIQDQFVEPKNGIIIPTVDISGKKVYAVIPQRLDVAKSGSKDQELNAFALALSHPITQLLINEIKKQTKD